MSPFTGLLGFLNKKEPSINLDKELRNSSNSVEKLVSIQNMLLREKYNKITLNITSTYISPALHPLVFSLPYFSSQNKKICIQHSHSNKRLHNLLEVTGVDGHYTGKDKTDKNKCLTAFKLSKNINQMVIIINELLASAPSELDKTLKNMLFSKIIEMCLNAHDHGVNNIGSFSNGYFDPKAKTLIFALYDLGIGIEDNVNKFMKKNNRPELTAEKAIAWAMTDGNTTLEVDYPRGAGFGVLESFIRQNKGKMFVRSGYGFCRIDKNSKVFKKTTEKIRGTFFSIQINC